MVTTHTYEGKKRQPWYNVTLNNTTTANTTLNWQHQNNTLVEKRSPDWNETLFSELAWSNRKQLDHGCSAIKLSPAVTYTTVHLLMPYIYKNALTSNSLQINGILACSVTNISTRTNKVSFDVLFVHVKQRVYKEPKEPNGYNV